MLRGDLRGNSFAGGRRDLLLSAVALVLWCSGFQLLDLLRPLVNASAELRSDLDGLADDVSEESPPIQNKEGGEGEKGTTIIRTIT